MGRQVQTLPCNTQTSSRRKRSKGTHQGNSCLSCPVRCTALRHSLLWPDDVTNTMCGCLGHVISPITIQTLLPRAWLIALPAPSLFSAVLSASKNAQPLFLNEAPGEKWNVTGTWTEWPCSGWQSWTYGQVDEQVGRASLREAPSVTPQ